MNIGLKIVTTFLCIVLTISLGACTSQEPALPSDTIADIKMHLGYALVPTYLPKGYEFHPDGASLIINSHVVLIYQNEIAEENHIAIAMIYPLNTNDITPFFLEEINLEIPADAITELEINNVTGYKICGSWSDDTLKRIERLEEPVNPEWDYEGGLTLRFAINIPEHGNIWVILKTVQPTDRVTVEELIRIAESVEIIK